MSKVERLIKNYSTTKLKYIVELQTNAYSEEFIDFAKDELIRRGEVFQYSIELTEEVSKLSDSELKKNVELEWENFHLEYLELARNEYLKRGFKYSMSNIVHHREKENVKLRYTALESISKIYFISGCILSIALVVFILDTIDDGQFNFITILGLIFVGIFIVVSTFASSDLIRLFINIEKTLE